MPDLVLSCGQLRGRGTLPLATTPCLAISCCIDRAACASRGVPLGIPCKWVALRAHTHTHTHNAITPCPRAHGPARSWTGISVIPPISYAMREQNLNFQGGGSHRATHSNPGAHSPALIPHPCVTKNSRGCGFGARRGTPSLAGCPLARLADPDEVREFPTSGEKRPNRQIE